MDGSHPAVPLFGTVRLTDRGWQIECEAHVKVRLRRHFPRAPQVAGTTMVLSANPENSRDLLWFLQRFPMHVEHAGELERLAALHVDTERRVAEILEARRPPPAFALAEPARDYQSVAGSLVLARNATLLADDVGLGKSVSAICAMTDPGGLPAVVVVPPHLCLQWRAYIARFAPALTVHVIQPGPIYDLLPSKKSRRPGLRSDALPDVVIVSYFMLRKWADTLAEFVRYVVFDECQQLRNPNSQLYESCVALRRRAERCIGLSATPISNYGQEFFWVLDAIDPGCMGTRQEFLRDHCSTSIGTSNERLSDPEGFGAWLRRRSC